MYCVWLKISPKLAQFHKLCMLTFQKLAVAQVLCVYIPKVSTSMLAMLAAFCIPVGVAVIWLLTLSRELRMEKWALINRVKFVKAIGENQESCFDNN